jgi:hypothetical protein
MTIKLSYWERKLNVKIQILKGTNRNDSFTIPYHFLLHIYMCDFILRCGQYSSFTFLWHQVFKPYTKVGHRSRLSRRHWNNFIKRIRSKAGWDHKTRAGWGWKATFRIPFRVKKIIMKRMTAADNGGPQQVSSPIPLSWNTRRTPLSGI